MKLAYQAIDAQGKTLEGTVEADDVLSGIESLRRQGLYVSKIDRAIDAAPPRQRRRWGFGRVKRLRQVALFSRELHVLLSTGTALADALAALEKQASDPAWRHAIADLRARVEEGEPLSKAMESHGEFFDPVCRSLLAAGESGGSFDAMLDRVAMLTRKQVQLRTAIRGAMIYPCLLIVVALSVLALMFSFVLPRFASLFQSLNVPLPPTTRLLIWISDFVRQFWWLMAAALCVGVAALKVWLGTTRGRSAMHTLAVRGPLLGRVLCAFAVARIVRVLGVLIAGKVPVLESLSLTKQTATNLHFARLIADAEEAVTRGSAISAIFAESTLVPPSLTEAIRSGERSGQLGTLLLSIADFMDEENEIILRSLTSIVEPLILIVLGLIVGFIAMSLFLPLFDLTSMTQRT